MQTGLQIERLTHWGVIEVSGDDAAQLLQSQLTQDIAGLSPTRAAPAGYCTAKGRMLGQFIVLRDGGRFLLLTHTGLADALVKRLSMFVLRLKCKLRNASGDWSVLGLKGDLSGLVAQAGVWQQALSGVSGLPLAPWVRAEAPADNPSLILGWPSADGPSRHLMLVSNTVGMEIPASQGAPFWQADDVLCGLPFLDPANVEAFVPQMVNLDVIGGVSFSKGCYPGQEIVARSHYLGKMKRRMQLGRTSVLLAAGSDIFASTHANEPAGRVVNAAHRAPDDTVVLFEISLDDLQGATLHAGAPDGPMITLLPLPYPLPAPNTPPGRG